LIIVDASVAVQWIAPEPGHEISASLLGRTDLAAPTFMLLEVANGLRRKLAAGDVSEQQALFGLTEIERTVRLFEPPMAVVSAALKLAMMVSHPIYDCLYVAMAEQVGGKFATRDDVFAKRLGTWGRGGILVALPIVDEPDE
jgi:predicted nucleic acid-binding protein